ncbi:hypothetical protein [Pedococcus bigeumensis]|uniref:hypothetical protein n=1 Tax=Pedococcus bigeumensis TaxID=433644 RepID=UPI0031E38BEE
MTARGGGLACSVGVAAAALAQQRHGDVPWLAMACVAALALVGFADDLFSLTPSLRLGLQLLCGAVIGLSFGAGWGLVVAAVVVVPTAVNVVNFVDGINGITGFTMALWGVTSFVLGRQHDHAGLALVGAATAGAAIGFLPWNIPTARIFLGDVGSYLFGGLVGVGLLMAWQAGAPIAVAVAPLIVHLFDTALTIARRARAGAPLMTAHREHIYQRLAGHWSHLRVSLLASSLALAVTAAWALGGPVLGGFVTIAGLATYAALGHLVTRRHTAAKPGVG